MLKKDLNRFISNYLSNSKVLNSNDRDTLIDYHLDYINTRKDYIYDFNSKGDIVGNEDSIKFNSYIDWTNGNSLPKFFNKPNRLVEQHDRNRDLNRKLKPKPYAVKYKYDSISITEQLSKNSLIERPIFYGNPEVSNDRANIKMPKSSSSKEQTNNYLDSQLKRIKENISLYDEFRKQHDNLKLDLEDSLVDSILEFKTEAVDEKDF